MNSFKNMSSDFRKKFIMWGLALIYLMLVVLIMGFLTARYIAHNERENEMSAAGFHFSSKKLKETVSAQPLVEGGVFKVDIRNYEVENRANISGMKGNGDKTRMDTKYTVEVKNQRTGAAISGKNSTSYKSIVYLDESDDTTGPVSAAADPETGNYEWTLPGNGEDPVTHTLTLGDADTGWSALVPVGETTRLTVTIASTSHYVKTLTASYQIKGIEVSTEDLGGGVAALVIKTNQYEGPLTLNWTDNTFPAAGVNEADHGWTVEYSANRQQAKRISERNSTYYFEYNGAASGLNTTISGSWAVYDEDNDEWSGGAMIEADAE